MERSPNYQSLKSLLEKGPLSAEVNLQIISSLAAALSVEHQKNQANLYLCPANIWLSPDLQDAQLSREHQSSAYLAPEQIQNNEVGVFTDLYSLGLILFEMSTGALPEGGERPTDRNADLPPWVDGLFDRCYAPRARRLASGQALVQWLSEGHQRNSFRPGMSVGTEVEEGSTEPVKVSVPSRETIYEEEPAQRRKINLFAGALGLAVVAFGGAFIAVAGSNISDLSGHVGGSLHKPPTVSNAWVQYNKAQNLYKAGQYQESKSVLDQLLAETSNFHDAYHLRGNVQTELGQMTAALEDFNTAIQYNPNNAKLFLDRGNTYVYLKKSKSAIQDFNMYLRLNPTDENAAQVRGWIFTLKEKGQL